MSDDLITPWRVAASISGGERLIVENDLGLTVAAMSLRGVQGRLPKMQANANAIVHRVNCHDKLVEALDRLMLQVINSGGQIHTSDCYVQAFGTCTCGAHGIYQDAKAALELAKGGTHD